MKRVITDRNQIGRRIAGPFSLAMISYCIFAIAWLLPAEIYTGLVHEHDLLHFNMNALVFYSASVAAFLLGIKSINFWNRNVIAMHEVPVKSGLSMLYICTPLIVSTLFCCSYLAVVGGQMNLVAFLLSQQGGAIKGAQWNQGIQVGLFGWALPFLTGTVWWAIVRAHQVDLPRTGRRLVCGAILVAILVATLTCIATVDRADLIPVIAGSGLLVLHTKAQVKGIHFRHLLTVGLGTIGLCVGMFVTMSVLRGDNSAQIVVSHIVGYTIAPYNRLAAIVSGRMAFPYGNVHAYLFPALAGSTAVNWVVPLKDIFGWPTPYQLWASEFDAVLSAGLLPDYNWAGAFGYLYSDIGWGTPIYMYVVGALTAWLWIGFRKGSSMALIGYPWAAVCVLFWLGNNYIFYGECFQMAEIAVLLWIWDKLLLASRTTSHSSVTDHYSPAWK